jgi:hypothetical protein
MLKDAGWVPKDVAERVRKGLREFQGAWKPKEEVEALRSQWENAWEVETDHYAVKANLPWEEVQALAAAVEDVYGAFSRVFGRAWALPPPAEKMAVKCYRTREEFQEAVRSVDPRAVNSPGFYNQGTRTAYFFRRDGYFATVFHECTHQAFDCLAGQAGGSAGNPQFWVIEGVPSCFETLEWTGRRALFFKKSTPKLEILRKAPGPAVLPLKEFGALTQAGFMGNQDRYAQALGLTRFLLDGDGGRYRDRFLGFVREVIQGRGTAALFEETFRDDLAEIEKGWLPFATATGK